MALGGLGLVGSTIQAPRGACQSTKSADLSQPVPNVCREPPTHRNGLSDTAQIEQVAPVRPILDTLHVIDVHDGRAMHAYERVGKPRLPLPKRLPDHVRPAI